MKTRLLLAIITWLFASSSVYATCHIEMDQSRNEGPFELRTNVNEVPNQTDERYGYELVASWIQIADHEPKAKDPRIYIYKKNNCEVVKIVDLYPKDTFLQVGSEYYGASFNKQLGLIYVTSRSVGIYPSETKNYNYTEIYSYEDLSLLNRFDNMTPLSGAEFINGGEEVVGFDFLSRQSEGTQIVVWSADDFAELKRSEPIGSDYFQRLGMQPSRYHIDIRYFERQRFKDRGYDLEFEDQYVIQLSGNDSDRNARAVEYTLEGKPLLTLWRENGKTIRGYPSDYEKKFNLKISPIRFNNIQTKKY